MQAPITFPKKLLYGKAIRRVLTDCLVDPVRTFGDSVHAFRLVWRRRTDEDGLARAWDAILSQRHLCDQVVARTPSLQMFVSCVSGLVTSAARGQSESAWRPIFPAVSYWAVFDQGVAIDEVVRKMSGQLVTVCQGAQLKLIQPNCSRGGGQDLAAMTLFIAVKDHCSSYVHQKTRRSTLAQSPTADFRPSNAKLVVVPRCKYIGQLRPSMILMRNVGMHMDLHELDEH